MASFDRVFLRVMRHRVWRELYKCALEICVTFIESNEHGTSPLLEQRLNHNGLTYCQRPAYTCRSATGPTGSHRARDRRPCASTRRRSSLEPRPFHTQSLSRAIISHGGSCLWPEGP